MVKGEIGLRNRSARPLIVRSVVEPVSPRNVHNTLSRMDRAMERLENALEKQKLAIQSLRETADKVRAAAKASDRKSTVRC